MRVITISAGAGIDIEKLQDMKRNITFSIIVTGFTAMASQIIYMREFLVVFYGNELSISFILAGWLISGALGSAVFGRLANRIRSDIKAFSSCQIILAYLLMAGIVAVKFIKTFLCQGHILIKAKKIMVDGNRNTMGRGHIE